MSAKSARTRVGIVGAGPSGLMLSHMLHLAGIDSVVIEQRSRAYIENRIRAGVLEHDVAELLRSTGLGARLNALGLPHEGTQLLFAGQPHRIDFAALTGKHVTVYGQHEVVRDLVAARLEAGGELVFGAEDVAVEGVQSGSPAITYTSAGVAHRLDCDVIAGCDGFHGICRPAMPAGHLKIFDRIYPFGWLGILADAAPSAEELIYANHENGFALLSMRSPTVSRMYLQCAPDEDVALWSDDRIWSELEVRLAHEGFALHTGKITQKSVTPMRSFVAEPMQCGRLFLVGDAAHIVPPTGAKGMNSAIGDVVVLSRALERFFAGRGSEGLEEYSKICLRRIWKTQRFSWWMTTMLHRMDHGDFDRRVQLAELDYVTGSVAGSTTLAENYVGLPLT
jgi:p-hydroxybenzoate 3-monooxygenase